MNVFKQIFVIAMPKMRAFLFCFCIFVIKSHDTLAIVYTQFTIVKVWGGGGKKFKMLHWHSGAWLHSSQASFCSSGLCNSVSQTKGIEILRVFFNFFFLCVCLNERNISLVAICAVILKKSCNDFAAKRHLAPALMHFSTKSWSEMVVRWRYADLLME